MIRENPTWGQARVAAELSLKLGIHVSPRTVRNYWPEDLEPLERSVSSQRWTTFALAYSRPRCARVNRFLRRWEMRLLPSLIEAKCAENRGK